MHNAVPAGPGISIALTISSLDATSTHLLTTATFHVSMHRCNGLHAKKIQDQAKFDRNNTQTTDSNQVQQKKRSYRSK